LFSIRKVFSRYQKIPSVIIFDELFDSVDVEGKESILKILEDVKSKEDTIILISHDQDMTVSSKNFYTVDKIGETSILL
jgi:ABC-type Mn2+/Zn2+ transport system ATPase subunit